MIEQDEIVKMYSERLDKYLEPMEEPLEKFVLNQVKDYPRIDKVVARAKGLNSFTDKALRLKDGERKYSDPLNQILDQIGVRIVSYYKADIPPLRQLIHDYFSPIEEEIIIPDEASKFGYEGIHFILFIPDDVRDPLLSKDDCPEFFELQIKTLFQHAWAEANHDLAYKSEEVLELDQQRKVAFTAAQAWGADHIFEELYSVLLEKNAP